jgi:hypothetical protein
MLTMTKSAPNCADHDVNFMIAARKGERRRPGSPGRRLK